MYVSGVRSVTVHVHNKHGTHTRRRCKDINLKFSSSQGLKELASLRALGQEVPRHLSKLDNDDDSFAVHNYARLYTYNRLW